MDESAKPSIEALLDHAGWVRALARTLVLDANEADDLAQETLTAALSARPAAGHGFKSWLATTLQNVKRQRWRRDVTRERFEALYARDREHVSSEDLAEQADLQRALVAHVLALDEPYRGVLLQRYFAARSPSEIAAQSGVSIATVTSQLTRAHHQLRKRLERQHGGGMSWLSAVVPLVPRAHVASIAGGILVSMKIALTVAAVVLVGVVVWLSTSHKEDRAPLSPVSNAAQVALESAPSEVAKGPASLASPTTPTAVRETAPVPSSGTSAEKSVDECTVFGRASDENDRPIAGVVVRLAGYKVWAEGVDVPRLSGKYDMRGWEFTTGGDGRFRFSTPNPTTDRIVLTLEPEPFHDSARVWLGGRNPGARAPLHAGDNDMGTFRLVPTGAIRGSVHDESGAPIVDVRLVLGPERSQTLDREGNSDAAGNFVVGHSPAGPMGLNAQADGFLSEFRKPIDVELGRFTDHVDFVLRKAPTLSGIVVDDAGKGVEGVRLWGWPISSGMGAGGKTRADGTFTVSLPQSEEYTLEATRDGFEPFGVNDRTLHYAPGTRDLRIVMKRLASSTLLVLDAHTEQPITQFGFEVLSNMSDHAEHSSYTAVRSPPPASHADGRVALSFRPGIDVVDIGARGYESQRFDPEPGNPPDGLFVVKLALSASVIGIVRIDANPASGVGLRLEHGWMENDDIDSNPALPKHVIIGPKGKRFRIDQQGTMSTSSTKDGSFRFQYLEQGTYRLIARAAGGQAAFVAPFEVWSSKSVDLGKIDLQPGAVVHGLVLVPPGRRASGLTVRIDEENYGEAQVTDEDGHFGFEGLAAGAHQFFLPQAPGSIGVVAPVEVQLTPGEVRDITVDARESGTCQIDLTILIGDVPAVGAEVTLVRANQTEFARLGRTDEHGRVTSSVALAKDVRVKIWSSDGVDLTHPTARFDLELDAKIVETIRFETGSVVVVVPMSVVMPDKFNARLELTPTGSGGSDTQDRWVDVVHGVAQSARVSVSDGGHRLQFDDVLAGDWQIVFGVSDAANPMERIQLSAKSWEERRKTMYSAKGAVKLVSGRTATVELH